MRRAIPFIHCAILLLSVWTGYAEVERNNLPTIGGDDWASLIAAAIIIVATAGFAFGAVFFFGAGHSTLRGPSLHRIAFNWWRDPLQLLFISTYFVAAMAIGAALRLRSTTSDGVGVFIGLVCIAAGLVLGQICAYARARDRIEKA
jgi:uncharacterized membrane protein YwaF